MLYPLTRDFPCHGMGEPDDLALDQVLSYYYSTSFVKITFQSFCTIFHSQPVMGPIGIPWILPRTLFYHYRNLLRYLMLVAGTPWSGAVIDHNKTVNFPEGKRKNKKLLCLTH